MFQHRAVILRESTNTKFDKSKTPLQVLIALTVIPKVLKY